MGDFIRKLCGGLCPADDPKPDQAGGGTRDAQQAGSSAQGGAAAMLQNVMLLASAQFKPPDPSNKEAYRTRVAQIIPADVRMFSGCKDQQTSADVSNVSSFSLPANAGPGGAGGACTNAMMEALTRNPNTTWKDLLADMRVVLQTKRFEQVPQLSSSKEIPLSSPFVIKKSPQSKTKALFIGINYVGHNPGELRGCHNDVETMKRFVIKQGFDEANMKFLLDDNRHTTPTRLEILSAFKWLIQGAKDGDSIFLHYSGHGGQLRDDTGDEADGYDETLVPLDYQTAGQIRDDDIFKELVLPLPEGVMMTVVMDCCHSGSIMDLPFEFTANQQNMEAGTPIAMKPNADFSPARLMKAATAMMEKYKKGAGLGEIVQTGMQMMKV